MSLEILLHDLANQDEKTRLRAVYQLGILGDRSAIAPLVEIAENDPVAELQSLARASIGYIDKSAEWDSATDAKSDLEFSRAFNAFLQKSSRFSPADIEDLVLQAEFDATTALEEARTAPPPKTQTKTSASTTSNKPKVGQYQMFWDCPACGTKKLLGVTHRFCPNCGTAQDPKLRYFPAQGEEVALENHIYHGVDIICPSCETPNSANASFCVNCGTDLKDGTRAALKQDQVEGDFREDRPDLVKQQFLADQAVASAELAERRRNATFLGRNRGKVKVGGILGFILSLMGSCFGIFGFKFNEDVTIQGHTWQRTYQIEEYTRLNETRDCPAPSGAYNITQRTVQRSRQVPDGQTCRNVCTDRRVDQGDGSYRVESSCRDECTTNYRTEYYPVQVCDYDINRWVDLDEEKEATWAIASGSDILPYWPNIERYNVPNCSNQTSTLGALCWSDREEKYTLNLLRGNGKRVSCELDNQNRWASFATGQHAQVQFTLAGRWQNEATCDNIKLLN